MFPRIKRLLFASVFACACHEAGTPPARQTEAKPPTPDSAAPPPMGVDDALRLLPAAHEGCEGEECAVLAAPHLQARAAEALPYLRRGCETSIGVSCGLLASFFRSGQTGVTPNPAAALALDERACELGYLVGCNEAGLTLLRGEGVPADIPKGVATLQRACAGDAYRACANLARHYQGTDRTKATAFAKRGCDNGDAYSCETLSALK